MESSAEPSYDLKQRIYAVRRGWRNGLFTSVAQLVRSTAGYPAAEFDEFDNLTAADDYLCTYLEYTNPINPLDESHVFTSVEVVGIPNGDASESPTLVAGIGIYAHPKSTFNLCTAIGRPISMPRERAEIEAILRILKKIDERDGDAKPIKIVSNFLCFHENLLSKLLPEYLRSSGGDNDDDGISYGVYDRWIDVVKEVLNLIVRHKDTVEFCLASPHYIGHPYFRMTSYLCRKALNVATLGGR